VSNRLWQSLRNLVTVSIESNSWNMLMSAPAMKPVFFADSMTRPFRAVSFMGSRISFSSFRTVWSMVLTALLSLSKVSHRMFCSSWCVCQCL